MSQKQSLEDKHQENKTVGKYLTAFQRELLQKSLREDLSNKQRQRIHIMLLADEGQTQAQICQKLGCCQATARHWIMMARIKQAHHWKSNPIGRPLTVNDEYLQRLKELVTKKPQEVNVPNREYKYPFQRWTAQKLSQHLHLELGIKVTPQHLNRLLKEMGLSTRQKPPLEKEKVRSRKGIQIGNLDSFSLVDTCEVWNFNPITIN